MGLAAVALVATAAGMKIFWNPDNAPVSKVVYSAATKAIAEVEPAFFEQSRSSDATTTMPATPAQNLASIESWIINSLNPKRAVKTPSKPAQIAPRISAKAYLVGNINTGKIYISSNENAPLPVASMSKLVTSVITLYYYSPTSTVEITEDMMDGMPPETNFRAGEKFLAMDLLYPMLLSSSNVAAEALASAAGRSKFLELMSSYAWEIGMPETYFADPSGIDPRNRASAKNIFALAKYLYNFHGDILALTRIAQKSFLADENHGAHTYDSIHPFVRDRRFIGGKTGRTPQAGETMLTILRIDNQPIAFVVMGSNVGMREADTRVLIGDLEKLGV